MPAKDWLLADWLRWLETLSPTEIDLGLERVRAVLDRLDLPTPPTVLLIGGTNGKGSSAAMAEALLLAAGHSTGVYTSPHLIRYNERIRINGEVAGDADIVAALAAVEAVRGDLALTYFEFGTLAALVQFAAADLDVWVLEVGLGGRLDATNAVEPDASLITGIALDHCDWLGDDVESIAAEKAGIMRPGKPVVFAGDAMPDTIRRHAAELGAELIVIDVPADLSGIGLPGDFQRRNASGVIALLDAAGFRDAVRPEQVADVLPRLRLDGRSQRLTVDGTDWLLDVAHNPAAAAELAAMLADDPRPTVGIVGVLRDKDVDGILAPLLPALRQVIALTADGPRALPAAELARRIANAGNRPCLIAAGVDDAVDAARRLARDDDRILVTGSFMTVGPVLQHLRQS